MDDETFLAALRWQYFVLLLSVLASLKFSWKYIDICDPETACGSVSFKLPRSIRLRIWSTQYTRSKNGYSTESHSGVYLLLGSESVLTKARSK